MSKADQLKNQLAAGASNLPGNSLTPEQQVGQYIKKMMPTIQSVIPKHVSEDRLARIALNQIRTVPGLLECTLPSLMGAVMESAKLGLEPGLLGQCYLLPYNKKIKGKNGQPDRWEKEAQFIIGYRGLIDLVRRSGQVSVIEAREVHENDDFDFEYGIDSALKHKPTLQNRGAVIAYYAVCKLKDGGYSFIVMSKQEVEQFRDKHAKAKDFGPWKDEFDAMAKKTVLRQLIKYLPISVEHLSGIENDEASGADITSALGGETIQHEGRGVDSVTGEIIDVEVQQDPEQGGLV